MTSFYFSNSTYEINGESKYLEIEVTSATKNWFGKLQSLLGSLKPSISQSSTLPSRAFLDSTNKNEVEFAPPFAFIAFDYDLSEPCKIFIPLSGRHIQSRHLPIEYKVQLEDTAVSDLAKQFQRSKIVIGSALELNSPPENFQLEPVESHSSFKSNVERALAAIKTEQIKKVVLARRVIVNANRPFTPKIVIERLSNLYPTCALFSIDGFVGASPELLISKFDRKLFSQPLAGTVGRSGDEKNDQILMDELLQSEKMKNEHEIVVQSIMESLEGNYADISLPPNPEIVKLRNVCHLSTPIHFTSDNTDLNVLNYVNLLHPTPAVGGYPTNEALKIQKEIEGFDRRRYAAPIGWMDANGNGEFYVGIRSAQITGSKALMISGVGIVADSKPDSELVETQLKFQAMLSTLVRP